MYYLRLKLGQHKSKFINFLNSGCPVSTDFRAITVDAFLEFGFVFLFVAVLKPYVIKELSAASVIQVSLVTAFIFSFFSWVYNLASYKKINIREWTFKKDIIRYSKNVLLATVFFLGYAYVALHYIYHDEIVLLVDYFFVTGFLYIFFIAIIFYFFSKFATYFNLMKSVSKQNKTIQKSKTFIFKGKNKDEIVETDLSKLIYIQSIGHYIKIFLKAEGGNVDMKVIRNSIGRIKKIMENHDEMFQCHRSFIVNINSVKSITGNSQKAYLILNNTKERVPVSRDNYKYLKKMYAFSENKNTVQEKKYLEVV
ncbi:LytTR family DNA-binding domain-containing protein [Lutibacter sp.]